jgi:hypothetical protein
LIDNSLINKDVVMSFIRKIKTNFKLSHVFNLQSLLAIFAVSLYVSSLFLPSVNDDTGYVSLFTGWMGLFVGRFSWLCNLYIITVLFNSMYHFSIKRVTTTGSVAFAIIFALLALETRLYGSYPSVGPGPQHAVFHLGYYLWVASFWLWAIRTLIKYDADKPIDTSKKSI